MPHPAREEPHPDAEPQQQQQGVERGGFDFSNSRGSGRDVLHLGDCDGAVEQLAELLGWGQELQLLVREQQEMAADDADAEQDAEDGDC